MCKTYDTLSENARAPGIAFATATVLHSRQVGEAEEYRTLCIAELDAPIAQCENPHCTTMRTMWTPEAIKAREMREAQCANDGFPRRRVHDMSDQGVTQQRYGPSYNPY
jgi:hypothetical protein